MTRLLSGIAAILVSPLVLALTVVALAAGASIAIPMSRSVSGGGPSEEAVDDIGPRLISIYRDAVESCAGLPWTVLAGIAKVESNHGRYGGATVEPDGIVSPPIIGIPLNGTNNTARIRDTDNGRLDGDTVWDRAVGPFQFIPSSWAIFGIDADRDGTASPHDIVDAAHAAVNHLCPTGTLDDIRAALFAYNRSTAYVDKVLEWADHYTGSSSGALAPPVDGISLAAARRTHHDYPAWDYGTPVGTPLFALLPGTVTTAHAAAGRYPDDPNRCGNTVTITTDNGAVVTYCHLTTVTVARCENISAGTLIGTSGGQPGARGAGNTTGPHLHLSLRVDSRLVCPQPLIEAALTGKTVALTALPTSGCTH